MYMSHTYRMLYESTETIHQLQREKTYIGHMRPKKQQQKQKQKPTKKKRQKQNKQIKTQTQVNRYKSENKAIICIMCFFNKF